jgi:Uncharacterized protein conserved in bacteria
MYTAMADIAAKTGDTSLIQACHNLWNSITNKRMYITGGIGSTVDGEAFSIDYDLPNDTVYAETCASIGLVFFAKKMLELHPSNKFADVMETALYNGVISGMQLDGKRFFYVNPLEVNPGISGKLYGYKHVLPERPGWYTCACCPPNLVRLLMSLGKYIWSESEDTIYSHLYIGGKASFTKAEIQVESAYPWEGNVVYTVAPLKDASKFTIAIRIPGYAKNPQIRINGRKVFLEESNREGYVYLDREWNNSDQIQLTFDMPVRRVRSNSTVRNNAGCVALVRGPFVYAFEGIDNGEKLQELRIPKSEELQIRIADEGILKGMTMIELNGRRAHSSDELYTEEELQVIPVKMRAIPYFAWGNRGVNQMKVWMMETED